MALHWWTVENTLYNCSNINRLASSPPVTLDDHSDAITNVMKLSDLNKCPHLIDLIQTTDHITLITTGKKETHTTVHVAVTTYVHVTVITYAYTGQHHIMVKDINCTLHTNLVTYTVFKQKLKYMYMYLIILCCIDC